MRIQLLTFPGCANAAAARDLLSRVVASSGVGAGFEELDTQSPDTPEPYRSYASPTILVDGEPVGSQPLIGPACCRLYLDEASGKLVGAPPEAAVRAAIAKAAARPH
jgi:hypothetical protein